MTTDITTPWTLHFDRDGTEDVATIRDADGDVLVTSRQFWLPEGDDPVPPTLAAVRLMTAAPKLLKVANELHRICGIQANLNSTATTAERAEFIRLVYWLWNDLGRYAVAEAEGKGSIA